MQTSFLHAGKMFFTASDSTPPEAAARPGAGHGLTAEGMAWRPTHGLRPRPPRPAAERPAGENGNALRANHAPQSRAGPSGGTLQFMHRNQVSRLRLDRRGAGLREILLPMSLPWLWSLAPAPALAAAPGSCLGLCSAGNRVAPRGPRPTGTGGWGKADMGRPLTACGRWAKAPVGLGHTLRIPAGVSKPLLRLGFGRKRGVFSTCATALAQSLALSRFRAQTPAFFKPAKWGAGRFTAF